MTTDHDAAVNPRGRGGSGRGQTAKMWRGIEIVAQTSLPRPGMEAASHARPPSSPRLASPKSDGPRSVKLIPDIKDSVQKNNKKKKNEKDVIISFTILGILG